MVLPPRTFEDLKDKDWRVRLNAVRVLAELPTPGAPAALAAALADEAAGVRWVALEALGALPTDIIREHAEAVVPCATASSWRERRCAVLTLGRLNPRDLLFFADSFAECLSDEDRDVRAAAASTLERLDVLLDDQDAGTRTTVINLLGELPASRLAPLAERLARHISDPCSAARAAAAAALRRLGPEAIADCVQVLGRLLNDHVATVREEALEAFGLLSPKDLALHAHLLRPLLVGTRSKSKRLALSVLAKLRPEQLWEFLEELISVLQDPGWRARLAALLVLERLGPRVVEVGAAARAVAAQLEGPSQLCCAALRLLGRFDPSRLADHASTIAQRLHDEGACFRFYLLEEMAALEPKVLSHHSVAVMSALWDTDARSQMA